MTKSSADTEKPWAFLRVSGPRIPRVFGNGDDLRTIINLYSVKFSNTWKMNKNFALSYKLLSNAYESH